MKKLLTLTLLSSIFLTGCSVDWNDAKEKKIEELKNTNQTIKDNEKQTVFENNLKCKNNITKLKESLDFINTKFSNVENKLIEIFFSKKENDCFFIISKQYKGDEDLIKQLYRYWTEIDSNNIMESCYETFPNSCVKFENNIKELKWE